MAESFTRNSRHPEWFPLTLKLPILLLFLVTTCVLIAVPTALAGRSTTRNGFATIKALDHKTLGFDWNIGLLWTTLPTLVFRLYSMYWDSITNALADRQPYVELAKDGGSEARKSILLDYKAVFILKRWLHAFRNGHILLGISLLLSLILSLGVTPLSARLFATKIVTFKQKTPGFLNETYLENNINATTDWVPVFDTVSAVKIHRGGDYPWTNSEFAFRPFFTTQLGEEGVEIAAETTAYSAYLNCSVLTDYKLRSVEGSESASSNRVFMTANDRGCDIAHDFLVTDEQKIYFKTTSTIDCSAASWYSRLVFTAAKYSSSSTTHLAEISVISCISEYHSSTGILTVAVESAETTRSPAIKSFEHTKTPDATRNYLWRVIEQNILSPVALNVQTEWSTTAFGSLILYYAQQIDSVNYLDPNVLTRSISDIFTASYLTVIALNGFSASTSPEQITVELLTPTQRIYVVIWAAWVIVIILIATAMVALWSLFNVRNSQSILTEQPSGLFYYAGVLEGSPLMATAGAVRTRTDYNGSFMEKAKEIDLVNAKTYWKASGYPRRVIIQKAPPVSQANMGLLYN
jgi:hypothetical protein